MRILAAACLVLHCAYASATVINFNEFEAPGTSFTWLPEAIETSGYRFAAVDGDGPPVILTSFQQQATQYNGSAALGSSNSSDIVMTRADGGAFSVLSVDLDALFGSRPFFDFVAITASGTTVQQVLEADYALGNETFALAGFENLVSLRFGGVGVDNFANIGTVDNIVAVYVAEPSVIGLLLGCLIPCILATRRRAALQVR